ncbi:hypothetical protein [Ramlibacter rhizophilus]|uniref:Uncharacterized protein n=1 Tax=Ramlibacter rhizophilus TaxID=1781167 RepID=A0A4Z0BZN5_9BURK|nr:hypothetical protein [Ramlibacter rhizophilus]TFZ04817.1 hypothetical protein EZ242_03440 [Ramlibacter rhizophilus]
MEDFRTAPATRSVWSVSPSSADALTVDTDRHGNVVIRHRDAFDEVETMMVIPGDYALRLAEAIGLAAAGGAHARKA